MQKIKILFGTIRLPFLILTPACMLLGLGAAVWTGGGVDLGCFGILLAGGICAHISVNTFNEYFDFRSGLDFNTVRTPFSGGSGTLPANPELALPVLFLAVSTLTASCAIGLFFTISVGISLLPLGLLGVILVATYTSWWTRHPLLCLLAPGLGFGPVIVVGTSFLLTGAYSWTALVASLLPFFLVGNLLLLNQFPDVDADRSAGRRHLPIVVGRKKSGLIYAAFLLLAYATLITGVLLRILPPASLLGLITVVLALPAGIGAIRHAEDLPRLMSAMGQNVLISVATPVLVAVGFLIR